MYSLHADNGEVVESIALLFRELASYGKIVKITIIKLL
jgi:hypothetical protein